MENIGTRSLLVLILVSSSGLKIVNGYAASFYVNVALGKPATQSSTYIGVAAYGDQENFNYSASLAVDGNKETDFHKNSCSNTNASQRNAWWEVDLEGLYSITRIKIYQRSDKLNDRNIGSTVSGRLENDTYELLTTLNGRQEFTFNVTSSNTFKSVKLDHSEATTDAFLCLCEVEVFAVNVAHGKQASQSSTYTGAYTGEYGLYNASFAVDGNTNANFLNHSCSHTKTGEREWWKVDLQGLYAITGIIIFQRIGGNDDWLSGYTLLGRESSGTYEIINTPTYKTGLIQIHVSPIKAFNEIMIQLNGTDRAICLCEVQIFGTITCNMPELDQTMGIYACTRLVAGACSYNSMLTIHCNTGYKLSGDNSSQCLDTGEWSRQIGACKVITCNMPTINQAMGTYTCTHSVDGECSYSSILTIHCNEGYKLSGENSCQCLDIDYWSNQIGPCEVINCEERIANPIHGTLMFKDGIRGNISYNTTVSMSCEKGYKLNGPGLVRCISSGQWEGNSGNCSVILCNESPKQPKNGFLSFNGGIEGNWTYNATASLTCVNGYNLQDQGQVRCNDSGRWEGSVGYCSVISCKEIPQQQFGIIQVKAGTGGNWTYNTAVTKECNPGYSLNGDGLIECTDSGQWNGTLGNCSVISCKEIPQQQFGIIQVKAGTGGNWTYNTAVTKECNPGYSLNGDGLIECTDSGQWNGTLGNCSVISCKEIPQQQFGIIQVKAGTGGNWTYNTAVTKECNPGYSLNGDGLVECTDSGQWNGTLGNCSVLETLKHGEPESSIAGVAGGVMAAICAVILGVIIAFILYKRRTRGLEDKIADTTLNEIPSTSDGKQHKEEVILEESIYAQPKKKIDLAKRPEGDESKNVYMNSNDSSRDYYSFMPQKVTDKYSVRIEDLSSFFLSRKMAPSLYEEEYNKLPNGLTKSHKAALLPENKMKNRYKNMYPYDDTRVTLEIWDPSHENDYINACYVNLWDSQSDQTFTGKGFKTFHAYIAAQGPTKGILNDFWRMIWQTKCSKIVMLTNLTEEGKHKCEQYWPDEGSVEFGDIVIRLVQCETFSDFTIRTLEMRKTNEKSERGKNEAHQIKQFHFTAWPDRGVPRFASSLVHFHHKILATNTRRNTEGPMVVHCSAGIGRTGTFLALDYLVDQAVELAYINVVNCVETLRKQRVNLVQTLGQYIFLHEALVEALTCTTMALSTSEFQETYRKLLEREERTGKRKLDDEFEKLPMYVSDPGEDVYENAKNMENRHKNRYTNNLPDKNHCPFLNVYVKGRDSYINAVFLPAYKENDIFIITQTPLENTIVDFWRMVYQFEVGSIVMLNTLSEMKEEERYWTEDEKMLEIEPFRITLESKSSDDICTNYTMLLNYHDERRRVRLSRATYWADGKPVPKSPSAMLKQIDLIQNWQQETGNKPIIVHCMNGAERSGLFCVIAALLERTKIEQDVAVEQIIKQMRSRRPQVIPNVDQFKFCYDAVLVYLDQFDTYSNFTGL